MSRAAVAALGLALLCGCATRPDPHPTPTAPISGCFLSCLSGRWFNRPIHRCVGSMLMEDILITGGEDVNGDPSESRWFTGADPIWVGSEITKNLAARGITPAATPNLWAKSYAAQREQIKRKYGDAARATYPKADVVLGTCEALRAQRCGSAERQCATHPGEDSLGRPAAPP